MLLILIFYCFFIIIIITIIIIIFFPCTVVATVLQESHTIEGSLPQLKVCRFVPDHPVEVKMNIREREVILAIIWRKLRHTWLTHVKTWYFRALLFWNFFLSVQYYHLPVKIWLIANICEFFFSVQSTSIYKFSS